MSYLILQGDVIEQLRAQPSNSVHCGITSPPYWNLRKYGESSNELGREPSPAAYVARMVEVFREFRRVLRPDGVLFINIGDSYANDTKWGGSTGGKHVDGLHGDTGVGRERRRSGLKPKDRCLIPQRLIIALQDDGWWVRDEIIWRKPNGMPFSGTDRTTPVHEPIYMLTKSAKYFYDHIAIQEPAKASSIERLGQNVDAQAGSARANGGEKSNGAMKAVQFGGNKYRDGHTKSGNTWSPAIRPQLQRAIELFWDSDLTLDHLDALVAVGLTEGKGAIQCGSGLNTEFVQQMANEAREVLGSYAREFLNSGVVDALRRHVETIERIGHRGGKTAFRGQGHFGEGTSAANRDGRDMPNIGRLITANKRSVWTVATGAFSEAHFATFPPALIEPMVLAGTSERGCCPTCGAPFRRVTQRETPVTRSTNSRTAPGQQPHSFLSGARVDAYPAADTLGWYPTCRCAGTPPLRELPDDDGDAELGINSSREKALSAARDLPTAPCVVMDPFNGAGTTGLVALRHGRRYIGIELYPEYVEMTHRRLAGVQSKLIGETL